MLSPVPDVAIVIVSVVASAISTMPSPAAKVSVSAIESARQEFPPETVMLLNTLMPERPAPLPKILLPLTLPVALILPVTSTPDVLNTAMLPVPPMPTVTFPPELVTFTFDVPLEILLRLMPVTPMVTVLDVLLPVIAMLSPAVSVTVPPTALANTAVPLA